MECLVNRAAQLNSDVPSREATESAYGSINPLRTVPSVDRKGGPSMNAHSSAGVTKGQTPRVWSDVPERLERLRLAQRYKEQCVHKLAAANIIEVGLVSGLGLVASAKGVEREVSEMVRIVVVARDEGIEAAGEPIYGRVEGRVIFVRENDVEISIELRGREFPAVL